MSTRQIRRMKEMQAAKQKENEGAAAQAAAAPDDDFEPLYVKNFNGKYDLLSDAKAADGAQNGGVGDVNEKFSLMDAGSPEPPPDWVDNEVRSQGVIILEDEDKLEDEENLEEENLDEPGPSGVQKKKKRNRKRKNKKREPQVAPSTDEMDEVDRAVAEVNAILGEPEPAAEGGEHGLDELQAGFTLLRVNHKYLNSEEELNRRFGPDEEAKKNQRPNILRLLKRQITLPRDNYNFTCSGITMEQIGTCDDVKFFKFVHNAKYQLHVRGLLNAVRYQLDNRGAPQYEVYNTTTFESIIQNADLYFSLDESSVGSGALEGSIHFLQSLFCPTFSYFDGKSVLGYEYVENRMFHIILLKYLHLLSNKACHRTALEIAKLLLNLDPRDPLAVIFIMDTLALRAREYQWLIDVYQHWSEQRNAGGLFHLMYSHALAKYELYQKSRVPEELESASSHLREAIIQYPNVAALLLSELTSKHPDVTNHPLFSILPEHTTSKDLHDLQKLYAAFVVAKWRENDNTIWLVQNSRRIQEQFDTDPIMKAYYYEKAHAQFVLFKEFPPEIQRHLYVIKSMSSLLVDGAVPAMRHTYSFNPYPMRGQCVDANGYFMDPTPNRNEASGWRAFVESLVPGAPAV